MIPRIRTLLVLALLLAGALPASAVTYYANCAAADDTGDGTSTGTAWKTMTKVNTKVFSAGDSMLFARGCTWTGIRLTMDESGAAGNPITVGAYGTGADPIIDATGVASGYGVYTAAAQYVVIDHLQVRSATTANFLLGAQISVTNCTSTGGGVGYMFSGGTGSSITDSTAAGHTGSAGILFTGASTGAAVTRCTVSGGTVGDGVKVESATNPVLTDVTSSGNAQYGLYLSNCTNATLLRCTAASNVGIGFNVVAVNGGTVTDCVASYSGGAANGFTFATTSTGITVTGCTSHHNGGDGINISGSGTGYVVQRCTAHDNGSAAIASGDGFTSHDTVGVAFRWNFAYGNWKSGVCVVGTGSGEISGNKLLNNYNATNADDWGIYISSTGTWRVESNITSGHLLEIVIPTGANAVTSDWNVFNPSRAASAFHWHGTAYDFAAYKAASGQDAHSVNVAGN